MFDKLVEFVIRFADLFRFWCVINQWERGIVLRLGKYHRAARPGLIWLWPFAIEHVFFEEVYRKVASLPPQSLTTADGKGVIVSAVVTYRVRNAKQVILQAGGHEEAIIASVPGTIGELVMAANWIDLNTEEFRQTVTNYANTAARGWGMEVEEVKFSNLVAARSLRLFAEQNHT